jgi:tRNA(Ile)-lysidine synthetase-like protein
LIVVHVDHGWRQEAPLDLETIQKYLNFHQQACFELRSCKLGLKPVQGQNAESMAREQRYQFFESIARAEKAKTVFLAHHLQDKQGTLLKNLFEGKELAYLDSLRSFSFKGELALARPFLSLEKKQILEIASEKKLPYQEDVTNADPAFLRNRMRQKLEPLLDEIWPTSWKKGLQQVSKFLEEWQQQLQNKVDKKALKPIKGILGSSWVRPAGLGLAETRFWLRELSALYDPLQREGSYRLSQALCEGRRAHKYRSKHYIWWVEKENLFAVPSDWEKKVIELCHADLVCERAWSYQTLESLYQPKTIAWQSLWQGSFTAPYFTKGKWILTGNLEPELKRLLLHRYQKAHVPAFLREIAPVWVLKAEKAEPKTIIWSFLDGKNVPFEGLLSQQIDWKTSE